MRSTLDRIHEMGRTVIGPNAGLVDREARFPTEALSVLREGGLLSAYVPVEMGGMGITVSDTTLICEALAGYCASTAMIFAMHTIQVACLVHHRGESSFFRAFLGEIHADQLLLASATSEVGSGGDLRVSRCAPEIVGDQFTLLKDAPVVSYGRQADAILATCRREADAGPSDQVLVLLRGTDVVLEESSRWDALGLRGTCSLGFTLSGAGCTEQILGQPFREILAGTMLPFSHITWSAVWLGLAEDAVARARRSVLDGSRRRSSVDQVATLRLAELDESLFAMRTAVRSTTHKYQQIRQSADQRLFDDFAFVSSLNNLKVFSSRLVVEIVTGALRVIGLSAYLNDSQASLCRQLRDAHGAALMVSNDRILRHNAALQLLRTKEPH